MKKSSMWIIRLGLAITFITIGFMILRDPIGWASLIQPWAMKLIPGSLVMAMQSTAILDIIIGLLFLLRPAVWLAALLGALHLIVVLITTGIESATVRDIGLLALTIALVIETTPYSVLRMVKLAR